MNPRTEYELWLEKLPDTDPMKKELQDISSNEDEIVDRFYQVISFGTAGLRGICGAGTNRMNELTVGRATDRKSVIGWFSIGLCPDYLTVVA